MVVQVFTCPGTKKGGEKCLHKTSHRGHMKGHITSNKCDCTLDYYENMQKDTPDFVQYHLETTSNMALPKGTAAPNPGELDQAYLTLQSMIQTEIRNCINADFQAFEIKISSMIGTSLSEAITKVWEKVEAFKLQKPNKRSAAPTPGSQKPASISSQIIEFQKIISETPECPIFADWTSPITSLNRFCAAVYQNPKYPGMELEGSDGMEKINSLVQNFTQYCASQHDNNIAQAFGVLVKKSFLDNKKNSRKDIITHLQKYNISSPKVELIMSLWHDAHSAGLNRGLILREFGMDNQGNPIKKPVSKEVPVDDSSSKEPPRNPQAPPNPGPSNGNGGAPDKAMADGLQEEEIELTNGSCIVPAPQPPSETKKNGGTENIQGGDLNTTGTGLDSSNLAATHEEIECLMQAAIDEKDKCPQEKARNVMKIFVEKRQFLENYNSLSFLRNKATFIWNRSIGRRPMDCWSKADQDLWEESIIESVFVVDDD